MLQEQNPYQGIMKTASASRVRDSGNQIQKSQSQVVLKKRLDRLQESDKKTHRARLGMLVDTNEVTSKHELE